MCRISGIIDFNSHLNYNISHINDAMRDTMACGGPDDAGSFVEKQKHYNVAFGHRRLSIIDVTAAGHQPMFTKDDSVVISYNGEMYNYEEVKLDLINMGATFTTHSDTEVILQAYKFWGMDFIQKFIGMFTMLLYDKEQHMIFAVRDRAGVKPLYYYHQDNIFLFGSELKSFHQHPSFKKEIDVDAVGPYLKFGYIPAPHTIFKNTFKVMPGHYCKIDLTKKTLTDITYWSATDVSKHAVITNSLLPEIITETENLLTSACNYRMVADVPVGVFLSGGYDSSLVSALLQKDRTEKIKTFSIGFHEEKFNEAPHAKKVAEHLGTDHTEYYCTQKDALEIIPTLAHIYDEPFGDSSAIPTTLVSMIARKNVKVALSADGGDEVFGGYDKYTSIINFKKKLSVIPHPVKVSSGKLLDLFQAETFLSLANERFGSRAGKFSKLLQSQNMGEILYWFSNNYSNKQLQKIVQKKIKTIPTNFDLFKQFTKGNDEINAMLAIDYITYLPDDILTKVDRATMSIGLEGREPLLDHRLVEWMAQVPGNYKIRNGEKKYILKQIVHKYIPKSIMDRPKMGFGVPVTIWFKKELKEYFEDYLSPSKLKEHGLFNSALIQKKKQLFYDGNNLLVSELWYLLMFQMWYEKWMN